MRLEMEVGGMFLSLLVNLNIRFIVVIAHTEGLVREEVSILYKMQRKVFVLTKIQSYSHTFI